MTDKPFKADGQSHYTIMVPRKIYEANKELAATMALMIRQVGQDVMIRFSTEMDAKRFLHGVD